MRFHFPLLPAEFEIPDVWWDEAGMTTFRPLATSYRSNPDTVLVPLRAVEPPFRNPEVMLDWQGFGRARMIRVLSAMATGAYGATGFSRAIAPMCWRAMIIWRAMTIGYSSHKLKRARGRCLAGIIWCIARCFPGLVLRRQGIQYVYDAASIEKFIHWLESIDASGRLGSPRDKEPDNYRHYLTAIEPRHVWQRASEEVGTGNEAGNAADRVDVNHCRRDEDRGCGIPSPTQGGEVRAVKRTCGSR